MTAGQRLRVYHSTRWPLFALVPLVLGCDQAGPDVPRLTAAPMPAVPGPAKVLIRPALGGPDLDVVGWSNDGAGGTALFMLAGDGAGGLAAPMVTDGTPELLAVGDVTADGNADFLLANELWAGGGDGTVSQLVALEVVESDYGFIGGSLADVTGDGFLDVIFGEPVAVVSIFEGDGVGGVESKEQFDLVPPVDLVEKYPVVTGHLTDDIADDVVRPSITSIDALLSGGDGAFVPVPGLAELPEEVSDTYYVKAILTLDASGDGLGDLVIETGEYQKKVWLAENLGDATFAPFVEVVPAEGIGPLTRVVEGLAAADLDGDGCQDVCFLGEGEPGRFYVFGMRSTCALSFEDPVLLAATASNAFAAGDLDGDGKADVVTGAGELFLSAR